MKRYALIVLAVLMLASVLVVGCRDNSQITNEKQIIEMTCRYLITKAEQLPGAKGNAQKGIITWQFRSALTKPLEELINENKDLGKSVEIQFGEQSYSTWTGVLKKLAQRGSNGLWLVTVEKWQFQVSENTKEITAQNGEAADLLKELNPQIYTENNTTTSDSWDTLNQLLNRIYGLPPVSDTEQMQNVAVLVSEYWFKIANNEAEKLEQQGIPWERTSPFFYLFYYYILHDTQLIAASNPGEFLSADSSLGQSVVNLAEAADDLIAMKQAGEKLQIFPSEDEARTWFESFDKDYFRILQEYTDKIKK